MTDEQILLCVLPILPVIVWSGCVVGRTLAKFVQTIRRRKICESSPETNGS